MTPSGDASDFVDPNFGQRPQGARPPLGTVFRQFARAVFADQLLGDAVSASVLAQMDPAAARADVATFFKTALGIWSEMATAQGRPFGVRQTVLPLPVEARATQAGILVDVLGIAPKETAAMLQLSEQELAAHLKTARDDRSALVETDVLIVEDDRVIAAELAALAAKSGARRVDVAHAAADAVRLAGKSPPRVVIADYDLGEDITGLDIVKALAADHGTVAVFVTAYPSDVLTGADGEPAFVLAKPYTASALHAALYYAATIKQIAIASAA